MRTGIEPGFFAQQPRVREPCDCTRKKLYTSLCTPKFGNKIFSHCTPVSLHRDNFLKFGHHFFSPLRTVHWCRKRLYTRNQADFRSNKTIHHRKLCTNRCTPRDCEPKFPPLYNFLYAPITSYSEILEFLDQEYQWIIVVKLWKAVDRKLFCKSMIWTNQEKGSFLPCLNYM